MQLRGKVAVITGGASGIGEHGTRLFAQEGAVVFMLDVNETAGLQLEKELRQKGFCANFLKTDISDPDQVQRAMEQIDRQYGKLDILYNNASVYLGGRDTAAADLSLDIWNKILSINLNGLFYCCKFGIPLLRKAGGGAIVNTASSAGVIGIPYCDAYTATKGATVSLTRSMAVEYGPENIRVNCIAPAAIRTEMVKQSNLNDEKFDEAAFLTSGTPLRRWGLPEEIAKAALFLASDAASYINGAILIADGGITIM
jgi:NAD(P)-dependent dehydrogenase (short-subunit alcohol dehydrogenase family)